MEQKFSTTRKGYSPDEVDLYIDELEEVIKSYKDKDLAIKNAILNAQIAADNIIKNAEVEADTYKKEAVTRLELIQDSIKIQRAKFEEFEYDYNALVNKYLKVISESEFNIINNKIDSLEIYISSLSNDKNITTPTINIKKSSTEE